MSEQRTDMYTGIQKSGCAAFAALLAATLAPLAPAYAASSEESRYTHASCEGANAICGVIVVGNAGGYTLDWVSLHARGTQPGGEATHPSCPSIDKKIDRNVPAGNYDTFVVPAACAYKLKLKILAGNGKDQSLYLTPGCQIITQVKGTTQSNSWKGNQVSALNASVPTNKDGKPIDPFGYKCGKQSSAGF